jgi:hypothetical protein
LSKKCLTNGRESLPNREALFRERPVYRNTIEGMHHDVQIMLKSSKLLKSRITPTGELERM